MMSTPDTDALIARLEAATEDSASLILEVFWAINPNYADDRIIRDMLDAGAYESAALTLVPKGHIWSAEAYDSNGVYPKHVRASAWVTGSSRAFAATPALAICIARLRAKQEQSS